YQDKVYTLPNPSEPIPGTSGMNSQDFKATKNKPYPRKILSPRVLSPPRPNIINVERGIEPFEEESVNSRYFAMYVLLEPCKLVDQEPVGLFGEVCGEAIAEDLPES
ncbi:jg277, partial [Pararge aegeria aegeria]